MGDGTENAGAFAASSAPVDASLLRGVVDHPVGVHDVAVQQRSGTILYVDDEPLLRRVAERILHRAGYDVIAADNGHAALGLLREDPDRFAAMLVDYRMPGLPGDEVIREALALSPRLPLACVSGDVGGALDGVEAPSGSHITMLGKPYTAEELVHLVDELVYPAG